MKIAIRRTHTFGLGQMTLLAPVIATALLRGGMRTKLVYLDLVPGGMNKFFIGALVKKPGFPAGKNSVIIYFSCEDCAVEPNKATDAGGRMQKAKTLIGPNGFISLVVDTEGNMIGLHSMK